MKKTIDFFKIILIYALTASMLVVVGLYINARQNVGQTGEIPREKKQIFEIGGMALAIINENHITPIQITVTFGGNSFTAVYDERSVLEIYENNIKYSIRDIFKNTSECHIPEKEEGEAIWRKCADAKKSVYVKFAGDYIYPFIYTFLNKTRDTRDAVDDFSGELAMVHEIFIIDDGHVYGVAKDTYGNVSIFSPAPADESAIRRRIGDENLSAYGDIATIPCQFLKDGEIAKNLKFPENFTLFDNYSQYSSVLEFSGPPLYSGGKINPGQWYIKNLFKLLNFNVENAVSYPDKNGTTFKDGKNTVSFYSGGRIIYNYKSSDPSEGGGVHLAKFLTYDAPYYTSYEKIKAASVFVSSLDSGAYGNECSLYLKSVAIDQNRNMKAVFSCYYEGIKVKIDGSDECIAITINENSFIDVTINSIYISLGKTMMVKNRNPLLDLAVIDGEISKESQPKEDVAKKYGLAYDAAENKFVVGEFGLVYNIDFADGDSDPVKAVWEMD